MSTEHLTPDELEALARGEETERNVGKHLEACAPCREAAREAMFATRYVRPLAGDHPDEHVLTALWSGALPSSRKEELKRHVAACSRCLVLFERLVRATPDETTPGLVDSWWLDKTKSWVTASTAPRKATLVVRKPWLFQQLRARFESITEALKPVASKPTALRDGKYAFLFRPYRDSNATRLAVSFVEFPLVTAPTGIEATLAAADRPAQHAKMSAGVEATFELVPGTSLLSIDVRPRWEIKVRFDA